MENTQTVKFEKLSPRTKWTYTLGGVGRDMAYSLYSNFLLTFILFTKQLTEAQFGVITVILIVCRIWDGFNDPIMGGIIENTRSRFGKFKPWILIGVLTNAVILALVFSLPIMDWAFVIAFAFLYLIWDITFTMNDIAYWSMLPSLSSEPKERATLTSMANLFAGLGAVVTVGLVPILTAGGSLGAVSGYRFVSIAIAVIFIGCQIMTVVGVKEKKVRLVETQEEKIGLKKMMKVIFGNKQLLWLAISMLIYNLGSSLILAFGTTYVYFDYGYKGIFVTAFTAVFAIGAGVINIFYPKMSQKLSRKQMQFMSIIFIVVGYLLFFFVGSFVPKAMSFYILCIALALLSFGQGVFYMNLTICMSNTIEYNEWKFGHRNESIIFSIRPFMVKLGSALQQGLVTLIYIVAGVLTYTNKISDIENDYARGLMDEATKGLRIEEVTSNISGDTMMILRASMVFIPIILLIAGYFIMKTKFKIDEKMYNQILVELEARHNGESVEASEISEESVAE